MTVVHILGMGRSGSTLLDRLVARYPSVGSAGELNAIWPALIRGDHCTCGETVAACSVWSEVLARVREAVGSFDPEALWRTQRGIAALRHLRRHVRMLETEPGSPVARLVEVTHAIYHALQRTLSVEVLVDSSKATARAILLSHGVEDHRAIHLVRDPRAVAYSWSKRRRLPEIVQETYAPQLTPAAAGLRWLRRNLALHLARPFLPPTRRLRYEDLCRNPEATLTGLAKWIGIADAAPESEGSRPGAPLQHMLAGNPMRLSRGRVAVRLDQRWVEEMRVGHRRLVAAITAPGLVAYGYPLRTERSGAYREDRDGEHELRPGGGPEGSRRHRNERT